MAQREELVLDITAKLDQALRDVQALQDQVDRLAAGTETTVTANVAGQEDIEALAETTETLDGAEAIVTVDADDNATDTLGEAADAVGDLDGESAEVTVEAEDNATDALEDAQSAVEDLDGASAEVTVEADTAAATEGLEEVTSGLDGMATSAASAAGPGGLGALAGPGGAIAAVTGALVSAATAGIEFTDSVEQLALASGASYQESSKLLAVLQDYTSIDASRLEASIGRIANKIADQPDLAAKLNIDTALPPLELFVQAIDALNSGQLDATERIQTGIDVFGRGGMKVVNEIAASLSGPLASAMDEIADKRILDDDDIARADELEAAMGELNAQIAEVSLALTEQLVPALVMFADIASSSGVQDALSVGIGKLLGPIAQIQYGIDAIRHQFEDDPITPQFDASQMGPFVSEMNTVIDTTVELTEAGERFNRQRKEFVRDTNATVAATQDNVEEYNRLRLSTEELADALLKLEDPAKALPDVWEALVDEVGKGAVDMERAKDLTDQLAQATNLAADDIVAMAIAESELRKQDLAEQLEKDAAAAAELAQAMRDVQVTIRDINVDDLDNMASALGGVLDVADRPLDFDILKGSLSSAIDEMQDLVDEKGSLDWNTALAGVRDQFQEGLGLAFQVGGRTGAEAFSTEFLQAISEQTGLSMAEVYEMVGIPGGDVEARLRLVGTEESKADAERILSGLAGVDPNNPIIAYIQAALQTGGVDPVIAEISALLLAQEMGVPVAPELLAFTPEQLAAAEALLAGTKAKVGVEADTAPAQTTIGEVTDAEYQATIDAQAETAQAAEDLLDEASRHRPAPLVAIATNTNSAGDDLDKVANPGEDGRIAGIFAKANNTDAVDSRLDQIAEDRSADMNVIIHGGVEAEQRLDQIAEDRYADIYVRTHGTAGGGGTTGGPETLAAPLAAPAGPAVMATGPTVTVTAAPVLSGSTRATVVPPGATVTNNLSVTVQAAVVGNRHEVERTVAKALRNYTRLNGSRN